MDFSILNGYHKAISMPRYPWPSRMQAPGIFPAKSTFIHKRRIPPPEFAT